MANGSLFLFSLRACSLLMEGVAARAQASSLFGLIAQTMSRYNDGLSAADQAMLQKK